MRIAVDVSPLALPRTGIGNYVRGMLTGFIKAGGDSHELVAFAAVSRPGSVGSGAPLAAFPSSEASGDAAVRAEPDDPAALAAALELALANRESLVARGLAHAGRFTWRGTGEAVLAGYGNA